MLIIKVCLQKVKILTKEKENDQILSHKRKKTIYIHKNLKRDIEDQQYPLIQKYKEKDRD